MIFTIIIYLLILTLIISSVNVFLYSRSEKNVKLEAYKILQEQLHDELIKQEVINEKFKLVENLNQSLKRRIFKIFSDFMVFQQLVLKNI